MDVVLEGVVAIDDLDLVAAVGPSSAYTSEPQRVTVTDGMLDVEFVGVNGAALVSAIEIRSVPADLPDDSGALLRGRGAGSQQYAHGGL